MSLDHQEPNCTGRWAVRTTGGWIYWRCRGCRAVAEDTQQNHEAAVMENLMGSQLTQLTAEGRELLEGSS